MQINVKIEGIEQIQRRFHDISRIAPKITAIVAQEMRVDVQRRFATQTAPDDTPWPESNRVKIMGGKTLVSTDVLRRSIVSGSDEQQAWCGTNVKYARNAHYGTSLCPGGILRSSKWIHIPISADAYSHARKGGTSANFPKELGFVLAKDKKKALLVEHRRGSPDIVHYVLKKEVRVPARHYLGVSATAQGNMTRRILQRYGGLQ